MATEAIYRSASEPPTDVAGRTVHASMGTLKRKTGELGVIEAPASECVHPVAGLTPRGQLRGHVVQRTGALIILSVAGVAVSVQSRVNRTSGSFVTGFAGRKRVRAQ